MSGEALRPSSQYPCYSEDCPRIRSGLDLQASALRSSLPTVPSEALRVSGGVRVKLGVDSGLQRIEVCQGSSGNCDEYRVNGTTLERLSGGAWNGIQSWKGVLYVDGALESLGNLNETAAVVGGGQMSIIARLDARLVASLYYSNPPCQGYLTGEDGLAVSNCLNLASTDLLSVTSLTGDVLIGNGPSQATRAARDLSISAALYAPEGMVGVENARSHTGGGQLNLLGAIRARYSPSWGSYVTKIQYDPRLERINPVAFSSSTTVRGTVGVQ